jgi:hypothetical protein
MTKILRTVILCLLIASLGAAQTQSPSATVCEIVAHPKRLAGRIVTVRAEAIAGFEIFAIEDTSGKCDRMWLHYAGGAPSAMVSFATQIPKTNKTGMELRRDAEFEKFDTLLNEEMHPQERGALCMPCKRYAVTATMTGRVDIAPEGTGFAHLNAYALRFNSMCRRAPASWESTPMYPWLPNSPIRRRTSPARPSARQPQFLPYRICRP